MAATLFSKANFLNLFKAGTSFAINVKIGRLWGSTLAKGSLNPHLIFSHLVKLN